MLVLRTDDGDLMPLAPARWHADPDGAEERLLQDLSGPVLDIGCGPGRVVAALGRRGIPALGVDPAPGAVSLARGRGANVLQRSVFDPLPGEGRWGTVVLFDGNVGIGGDAVRLLRRCRHLAAPSGTVLVEVEAPGWGWRTRRVRLEYDGDQGPWFPWAVVGADAIADLAGAAGLRLVRLVRLERRDPRERLDSPEPDSSRWFAHLEQADAAA